MIPFYQTISRLIFTIYFSRNCLAGRERKQTYFGSFSCPQTHCCHLKPSGECYINPLMPCVTFLYPLKTENLRFSDVFRGYKNVALDINRLTTGWYCQKKWRLQKPQTFYIFWQYHCNEIQNKHKNKLTVKVYCFMFRRLQNNITCFLISNYFNFRYKKGVEKKININKILAEK